MSKLLKNIIDNEYKYQEENNIWNDSIFSKINLLKNDHSGKIGERFINNICLENGIICEYKENINSQNDGTYDLKIKNKRIEIKTARFGNTKTFQHENLHNGRCDYYLFMDIKPNNFYITILQSFDLNKKCSIMNRKPHLRKGTHDIFKFDFSELNIKKSIKKGSSICISSDTISEDIIGFINTLII